MKIFYDTEFLDDGRTIDLISIGMVAEDGRELYAVSCEFDQAAVCRHDWLMANVWPSLPIIKNPHGKRGVDHLDLDHPDVRPRAQIARMVQEFIYATPNPDLWAYYSAYDHVAYAQLFGPMSQLPAGLPMQTDDLVTEAKRLGLSPNDLPTQTEGHHNAIEDARHNRVMAQYLDAYAGRTALGN
ncbi:3'-5' exoribonuclease [Streptomyces albipurpureus]|uniref:3'-5' exoribonuclease n=1 Tax=Streptomyces albipurpureus TaxID=2897419 RepID=A0ABT0V1H9_9ACTN|nr:3'-5' exoribonuclease [Streptomyces sp. CWNU-1]MCM2394371.1 3'-5' exoribonuclease [Streptomyces sp. CWNU-1]